MRNDRTMANRGYRKRLLAWCTAFILVFVTCDVLAVRIKDIADIQGVRRNQLVGYGLVVGLDGTGDGNSSVFTTQSMASMLQKMGVTVNPADLKVENVASVMLTADLPPFARNGSRIDVLVSSIGDAENLQGGTLIYTPLKGADGNVYAVAQGPVITGGFAAEGAGGSLQKNFPTVGSVINGATIEREMPSRFNDKEQLSLSLHAPDFTTATRMAGVINSRFPYDRIARTRDSGTIDIHVPQDYIENVVEFVATIEGMDVVTDAVSKVIVNERTGTVIMGEKVRISTIAIAHGNLSVQVKEGADVSQPLPFSDGQTVAIPDTNISVTEETSPIFLVKPGISIGELVRALNALGVSPRDLIAILQAIKAAGALQARLEII